MKVRAARDAGQSLQACVRQLLIGEAGTLTPGEFVAEARSIAPRGNATEDGILAAVDEAPRARPV